MRGTRRRRGRRRRRLHAKLTASQVRDRTAAQILRRGNPLRNTFAPTRIEPTEIILERNPSPLVRSRRRRPNPTKVSPKSHAPILWTRLGFGEPLQRKASTLLAFLTVPGKTIFFCLSWRSSTRCSRPSCRRWLMTSYSPARASSTVGKNANTVSRRVTRNESRTAPLAPARRILPLTFIRRL
jgi:hypothetical protein